MRGAAGESLRVLDYGHDRHGNVSEVLANGELERAMVFDRGNRLLKVTTPGSSAGTTQDSLFSYDHDLQRISRTDADGTATFYISHNYEITRTANGVRLRTRYLGTGDALKVSFTDTSGESEATPYLYPGAGYPDRGYRYFATDQRGTTRLVTDAAGRVRARMSPGPWAEHYNLDGQNNFRPGFIGQERDRKTGLDYLNARYYDPVAQQFLSTDPAGEFDNPYLYSPANPVAYSDPSGRISIFKLARKLGKAYDEGKVVLVFGAGSSGLQFDDQAFTRMMASFEQYRLTKFKVLDLRRSAKGVWTSEKTVGGTTFSRNFDNPGEAIRYLLGDKPDSGHALVFEQRELGHRLVRIPSGRRVEKVSFKDFFDRAMGEGEFNRVFNMAIDVGRYQGSSERAAKLARSLQIPVYASPLAPYRSYKSGLTDFLVDTTREVYTPKYSELTMSAQSLVDHLLTTSGVGMEKFDSTGEMVYAIAAVSGGDSVDDFKNVYFELEIGLRSPNNMFFFNVASANNLKLLRQDRYSAIFRVEATADARIWAKLSATPNIDSNPYTVTTRGVRAAGAMPVLRGDVIINGQWLKFKP